MSRWNILRGTSDNFIEPPVEDWDDDEPRVRRKGGPPTRLGTPRSAIPPAPPRQYEAVEQVLGAGPAASAPPPRFIDAEWVASAGSQLRFCCGGAGFCAGLGSSLLLSAVLLIIVVSLAQKNGGLVRGGAGVPGASSNEVPGDPRMMLVVTRNSTQSQIQPAVSDSFWHILDDVWRQAEPTTTATSATTATDTYTTVSTTSTAMTTSTTTVLPQTTTARVVTTVEATTSVTIDECMVPEIGDDCYNEVIKEMYQIREDASGYKGLGLNIWSSFEEVQDFLHGASEQGSCGKSCACQTALAGSKCYDSIAYVINDGIRHHPEWYEGMSPDSTPEEFQSHLSKWVSQANCSRPCKAAAWRGDPSLFCWSLSRSSGYEVDVMKSQLQVGGGVFGCDGFAVVSEDEWTIGTGPGGRLGEVKTIQFRGAEVGVSKDGTAGNAELFMLAWNALLTRTTVLTYDWVLKVDPDAVVLADRLRDHLRDATGAKHYVRNCNSQPENPEFPMMFGSLEAISKEALKQYKDGMETCVAKLSWSDWGEDVFMGKCLTFLGVDSLDDFSIISDGVCTEVDCYDARPAAFHPFKSSKDWLTCWESATAGLGGPPPPLL
jgi:hypothetical protein